MNIALEIFNRTANDLSVLLPEIVRGYKTKDLIFYLQTTKCVYKFQKYVFIDDKDSNVQLELLLQSGNYVTNQTMMLEFTQEHLQLLSINTTMDIIEDLQEFGLIRYIQNEDKSTSINFYKLIDFQDMFDSIDRSKEFINTRRIKIRN